MALRNKLENKALRRVQREENRRKQVRKRLAELVEKSLDGKTADANNSR